MPGGACGGLEGDWRIDGLIDNARPRRWRLIGTRTMATSQEQPFATHHPPVNASDSRQAAVEARYELSSAPPL